MDRKIKISLIFFLGFSAIINAQIESPVGALSHYKVKSWFEIKIDSLVLSGLAREFQPKNEGYQFAVPVPVNLSPKNSGDLFFDNNETIWILGIRSKEAKSLNLILEPFNIPAGAYVYIFDSDRKVVRGAFTNENNYPSKILPTMPVPGEELILEYHFPKGAKWENTLGVSQVSHDFLGVFGISDSKDGRFKLSQSCNIDINCNDGQPYAVEKQSVCRLLIRGSELCTGVLLNNTLGQNRPLLLTASHCITDQNDADKTLFVFGYESPWCNGPDGRVSHSLSGSVLRTTDSEIDFTLVELNTFPPYVYMPYMAGWNVSGVVPSNSASIHHPMGDVKKISKDFNPPVSGTFNNLLFNSSWQILQWDKGTTEGGSSGAPLFDQNKSVVGILVGGEADCNRPVNDFFTKLSEIYKSTSPFYTEFRQWVDPSVSGALQLNGRDPYIQNRLTTDTLSNFKPSENVVITEYPPAGNGYSTGFNSDSLVMYAEYFTNPAGLDISEVWLNIAKAKFVSLNDSIKVFVYSDDASPSNIIASQKIFIREALDSSILKFDFNTTVPVTGNFYIGWQIKYVNPAQSETRQFALYHSPDRILPEKNTAWFNDGSGWKKFTQHPFAPMSVSLDVKAILIANSSVNSIPEYKMKLNNFRVSQTPASGKILVSSENVFRNVNLKIISSPGIIEKTMEISGSFPGTIEIDDSPLKPGLYILTLTYDNYSESHKLLIIK